MTRTFQATLLCALVALAVPATSEAQLKGLIKKKVASEVKDKDKAADGATASTSTSKLPNGAIEITEPVGEALLVAVELQARLLGEFRQELAQYKTPEEFRACSDKLMMTPEGQKIATDAASQLPEDASVDDIKRMTEKMATALSALQKKQCGVDVDEVWPYSKRNERVDTITHKAATTFGSERVTRTGVTRAPRTDDEYDYGLTKERIVAFCTALAEGRIKVIPGEGVRFPGDGTGVYWVYTASEAEYLSENCERLMKEIEELEGLAK